MSMESIVPSNTWSKRLTPLLTEAWWEARKQILTAPRTNADEHVWLLEDPDHMGDPAQKVDQHMHQFAADGLHRAVPRIQVFGEEAPMSQLLLSNDFPYVAYLDAVDGSAQAWALPGAWGHVIIVQQYQGVIAGEPYCPARYIGVLDAEGGTTVFDAALPGVAVDMIDQMFEGGDVFDDEMVYYDDEAIFEVTKQPVLLVGGYKPTWWKRFAVLRERILHEWPKAQVFNTAGSPVTRKVIQNGDNVVAQLTPSSLWDGAGAALIAQAGGAVIPIGNSEPLPRDQILSWWSRLGYEPDPSSDGEKYRPALRIPPFVAGMKAERVQVAARLCRDLPS
ncbi:MAG: hypothetical protein Q4D79_08440 [Propionibacteriaceae bacterium]|nr:hypothetical protein [Propionibacteriaceae bacterium]